MGCGVSKYPNTIVVPQTNNSSTGDAGKHANSSQITDPLEEIDQVTHKQEQEETDNSTDGCKTDESDVEIKPTIVTTAKPPSGRSSRSSLSKSKENVRTKLLFKQAAGEEFELRTKSMCELQTMTTDYHNSLTVDNRTSSERPIGEKVMPMKRSMADEEYTPSDKERTIGRLKEEQPLTNEGDTNVPREEITEQSNADEDNGHDTTGGGGVDDEIEQDEAKQTVEDVEMDCESTTNNEKEENASEESNGRVGYTLEQNVEKKEKDSVGNGNDKECNGETQGRTTEPCKNTETEQENKDSEQENKLMEEQKKKVIEEQEKPMEEQEKPMEEQDKKPMEEQEKPMEEQEKPMEEQEKPMEEQEKPMEEQEKPMEEQEKPMEEQEKPKEEQEKPMEEQDKKPMEEQEKPMEEQEKKPIEEQEKPMEEQDKKLMEQQEKPMEEQEKKPMEEQEKPMEDQEKTMEEQEKPMEEQEKKPIEEQDKKPMEEQEKPMEEQEKPTKELVEGQENEEKKQESHIKEKLLDESCASQISLTNSKTSLKTSRMKLTGSRKSLQSVKKDVDKKTGQSQSDLTELTTTQS